MNGQWVGTYTGSSKGAITVNIDERESYYQGTAYLAEDQPIGFIPTASFKTADKNANFRFRTNQIQPVNPTGLVLDWDAIRQKFPNTNFSQYADVTGSWDKDSLTLNWVTDIGAHGTCTLPRSKASQPSELVALDKNWDSYKEYVSTLEMRRPIFRGQNGLWRLQTSFHRTGRADLARFLVEDVSLLHRHLSARTRHVFNLGIPDENGSFFNLIQHHGYPTPLLDWTYSPFVAAYFAYRKISNRKAAEAASDAKVRILVFNQAQWCEDCPQVLFVVPPTLHLSVCEFIAIENERMVPQQAVSTVTNVDDIETYVREMEARRNSKYLSAIDLPVGDRKRAIRDLSYMGITAGSLFPGLDGTCEELAERNFQR